MKPNYSPNPAPANSRSQFSTARLLESVPIFALSLVAYYCGKGSSVAVVEASCLLSGAIGCLLRGWEGFGIGFLGALSLACLIAIAILNL